MYRSTLRLASRPVTSGSLRTTTMRTAAPRRFASTTSSSSSPSDKARSWKSSAFRWGLAIAGVYYYNTSSVFSDEVASPIITAPVLYTDNNSSSSNDSSNNESPTVDALVEKRKKETFAKLAEQTDSKKDKPVDTEVKPDDQAQSAVALGGSPLALEEEAGQQGAFNPETGEINWDCPCLGGMADGPCGEEFKTAFSCFVYSEEEPKGMDCIEKFQGMQDCFRKYPEIYGSELEDTESESTDASTEAIAELPADAPAKLPVELPSEDHQTLREEHESTSSKPENTPATESVPAVKPIESAIPVEAQDATTANETVEKGEEEKKLQE